MKKHNIGSDIVDSILSLNPFIPKTKQQVNLAGTPLGVWDYYNITMGFLNGTRILNQPGSI